MAIDNDTLADYGLDDDGAPARPAKKTNWPRMPDHDKGIGAVRDYLTAASRFPEGWRAALCERFGLQGTDAMELIFSGPEGESLHVRFDTQAHAGKPATLRAVMASQTSGLSRMRHPSQGQAADFYTMCCALARALESASTADVTREDLRAFLEESHPVTGHGLTKRETLRAGLTVLRARSEWRRKNATRYLQTPDQELDQRDRPICLVDAVTEERWVRAGELATWFRHVATGYQGGLSQVSLDGLLVEIGVTKHTLQTVDGQKPHLSFTLYRVPPANTVGAP